MLRAHCLPAISFVNLAAGVYQGDKCCSKQSLECLWKDQHLHTFKGGTQRSKQCLVSEWSLFISCPCISCGCLRPGHGLCSVLNV
jgi:hypothetical protein